MTPVAAAGSGEQRAEDEAKIAKTVCRGTGSAGSRPAARRRPAGRSGGGGDAKRERTILGRSGAADHRQHHAKAGAGNAEAHEITSRSCICAGVVAIEVRNSPAAYISARGRSPCGRQSVGNRAERRLSDAQARFWMAMASENSARGQPNSWRWEAGTPETYRRAKLDERITQPAISTGVKVWLGSWGAPVA